jgi:hypothetical protein
MVGRDGITLEEATLALISVDEVCCGGGVNGKVESKESGEEVHDCWFVVWCDAKQHL